MSVSQNAGRMESLATNSKVLAKYSVALRESDIKGLNAVGDLGFLGKVQIYPKPKIIDAMKEYLIILLFFVCYSFAGANESDFASVNALSREKSLENLKALVEIVKSYEVNKDPRAYAFFKIKDQYIPENAITAWRGRDHITWEDMVEFTRSRTEEDLESWLGTRPKLLAGFGTENYKVEVYSSDLEGLHGKSLLEMTAAEILEVMNSALLKRHEVFNVKKFDFKRMFTGQWVVFGFFEDENGEDRLLALVDSDKVIFDQER